MVRLAMGRRQRYDGYVQFTSPENATAAMQVRQPACGTNWQLRCKYTGLADFCLTCGVLSRQQCRCIRKSWGVLAKPAIGNSSTSAGLWTDWQLQGTQGMPYAL